MLQSPVLPAVRIRGLFQRDREPQAQYGVDAAMEVSLLVVRTNRVNVHRVCTSLREAGRVNYWLVSLKLKSYLHKRECLRDALEYLN